METFGAADILCFSKKEGQYSGQRALSALVNGEISNTVWNKLYKNTCFINTLFPEGMVCEDTATVYKLLFNAKNVSCVNIRGYHWRNRIGSITHTHNERNLIDNWNACKERFEYCKYIVDSLTYINVLKTCAYAIARAWAWRIQDYHIGAPEWAEMEEFCNSMFPYSVKKHYPIRLRIGLFLCHFNHPISFRVAYILNQLREMEELLRSRILKAYVS